jgi:acetate kinase
MSVYAPRHNPPALNLIRAAQQRFPGVPQVAVFDTAFHATMPEAARTYGLNLEVAQQNGIRRFGFHGISVAHAVRATSTLLGRDSERMNMVVAHLGNGASVTAIERGRSVDTSMGLTPLEGLVMGDRAGDMDPAITFHLARAGWKLDDIEAMYENDAGLRGLCGDNDMRRILSRADGGDRDAELALAVYCYRVRKYIGAYLAVLGHADAIVFTGGVGENAVAIRARVLAGLETLGIVLDISANADRAGARIISGSASRTAICVVPAAEEEAIAHETARLLGLCG